MTDSTASATSADVITKLSPLPVAATVTRLTDLIGAKGMRLFAVIDQRAEAQQAGLDLRDTVLVMFGSPAAGTPVMDAAPLSALDLPLKVLVWEDGKGVVSVSYNSPESMTEKYGLDGSLRAPFDAIESIVEAMLAP